MDKESSNLHLFKPHLIKQEPIDSDYEQYELNNVPTLPSTSVSSAFVQRATRSSCIPDVKTENEKLYALIRGIKNEELQSTAVALAPDNVKRENVCLPSCGVRDTSDVPAARDRIIPCEETSNSRLMNILEATVDDIVSGNVIVSKYHESGYDDSWKIHSHDGELLMAFQFCCNDDTADPELTTGRPRKRLAKLNGATNTKEEAFGQDNPNDALSDQNPGCSESEEQSFASDTFIKHEIPDMIRVLQDN